MLQSPLIVLVVSAELEQNHGLQLYRENIEELQHKDAIRARAFRSSAILLTTSLLVLMALIFVLSKLQLSYGLAPNSHLIAFLPKECAAELGALKRHMARKKASFWHIHFRLLTRVFNSPLGVLYPSPNGQSGITSQRSLHQRLTLTLLTCIQGFTPCF